MCFEMQRRDDGKEKTCLFECDLSVFVSLGLLLEYLLVNAITAVVFKFEVNIAAQESFQHCHDVIFSG